jgi:hypothetical protein
MKRTVLVGAAVATLVLAIPPGMSVAEQPLLAQAKKGGFPAQNCQYCHVPALPKKETFKPDDLNERGKWLAAEKAKRNATTVSVEWLNDYPGGKEQKK